MIIIFFILSAFCFFFCFNQISVFLKVTVFQGVICMGGAAPRFADVADGAKPTFSKQYNQEYYF